MNQKEMDTLIKHYDTYFKQDDCRVLHPVVMEPHIVLGTDLYEPVCLCPVQQHDLQAHGGLEHTELAAQHADIIDDLRHFEVSADHLLAILGRPLDTVPVGDKAVERFRVERHLHKLGKVPVGGLLVVHVLACVYKHHVLVAVAERTLGSVHLVVLIKKPVSFKLTGNFSNYIILLAPV